MKKKFPDFFTEGSLGKLNTENLKNSTNNDLITNIPGPMSVNMSLDEIKKILKIIHSYFLKGKTHILFTKYQEVYGTNQESSNIIIPYFLNEDFISSIFISPVLRELLFLRINPS